MRRRTASVGATASNAFWWQCPCSSARFCGKRGEREIEASRAMLAREELLDQEGAFRQALRGLAETHHQELVAQRQQARRLEADDRRAALDVRRERGDDAPRLALRLVDEARGEVGPAAAQRPARLRIRAIRHARHGRGSRRRAAR